MKRNIVTSPIRLVANLVTAAYAAALRGRLALMCLALAAGPGARAANLTWTTATSSLKEGAGTWNQGVGSLPSGAPWYNGSTYGNTMSDGDTVTFGGGTVAAGVSGNITLIMLLNNLITGATAGGTVRFQLNGNGVVTVAKANTYSAPTVLEPTGANASGTLKLGISDALPTTTDFTINTNGASVQTPDLAGFNQTVDSLATATDGNPTNAIITNSGEAASTLTVAGAGKTTSFGGRIAGKVNLTLNGSGSTLALPQPALSALTTVTVSNSATLQLDFAETNTVAGLVLNGTKKPAGVYSALTDSPYLAGTGSLQVRPVATNPTNITYSVTGNTLALSWPADHLGWSLQAQTNSLSIGIGTNWITVPGSDAVTSLNVPINQANPAVCFRLKSP